MLSQLYLFSPPLFYSLLHSPSPSFDNSLSYDYSSSSFSLPSLVFLMYHPYAFLFKWSPPSQSPLLFLSFPFTSTGLSLLPPPLNFLLRVPPLEQSHAPLLPSLYLWVISSKNSSTQ
ncbi:hypothetical protein Pcinc_021017 [Petrolisthes cinctipes]|uniref:Uncharacterized protein n=1 Tax=Petrolisthes cinctipes TaxID=88211 RepID=A0AAE1KFL9_PETCI|nr:hypothetical protein Pcinc_021017 [Petrolisthes cinctipes]